MDFFSREEHARGLTRRLILLFALALAAIVGAVDVLALLVLQLHRHMHVADQTQASMRGPLVLTTVIVLGGILLASAYRMFSLSAGGRAVAEAVGAQRVLKDTADPRLRRLRNVVEEMALAAGIAAPAVYVLPGESAINAFAAGFAHGDAALCVTQGCLERLDRDELQGVVAHEFSHVLNGDMRLSIWIMGLLFGIHALAVCGEWMTPDPDEDDRFYSGSRFTLFIGPILLAIGSIGYFFGQLIQAAVARSRESLADASAVQFTRQAVGLAGALKKTATYGARLGVGNRREIAHMLFNPSESLHPLMATHPPLIKRIRELEPSFSEHDLEQFELAAEHIDDDAADESTARRNIHRDDIHDWRADAPDTAEQQDDSSAGAQGPSLSPIRQEAPGPQRIPDALLAAVRQPESAIALALALAPPLSPVAVERRRRAVASAFGDDMLRGVEAVSADARALPASLRLPLTQLTVHALAQLPEGRRQTLLDTLDEWFRLGSPGDFGQFVACLLLRARLRAVKPAVGTEKLFACRDSFALVVAVVASRGSHDEAEARRTWLLATQQALLGEPIAWKPLPTFWQVPFEQALNRLNALTPAAKELVVQSLLCAVQADRVVSAEESELLHAVCAWLDCPAPKLAPAAG